MVIELGPPVSESATRTTKFDAPTASEHKFPKNENQKLAADGTRTVKSAWQDAPLDLRDFSRIS